VGGADFGDGTGAGLVIAQRLEGGLDLRSVGRDDAGELTATLVVVGEYPALLVRSRARVVAITWARRMTSPSASLRRRSNRCCTAA
jgi:hypothetical protein